MPIDSADIERARRTDLAEYLRRQGETLRRSGSEWEWRHEGAKVTIRGNLWFHQYDRQGGDAISFVRWFGGKTFAEAVQVLLGQEGILLSETARPSPKPFLLPPRHTDMRRVYAYLLGRYIDREVIHFFAHRQLLYEDAVYHNAVFVGMDENGVPRHAHKRGTVGGYKGNVSGSWPSYSFHWVGTGDKLYVFEAPVDVLSYITLHPENWPAHSYVALCGTSEQAAIWLLRQYPHLRTVVLCLDADKAGIEGGSRLRESISKVGNYTVREDSPHQKDWNECLKAENGENSLPAKRHPGVDCIRRLCAALPNRCRGERVSRWPMRELSERYTQLKQLQPDRKRSLREQSLQMAGIAFLYAKARYCSLEISVSDEALAILVFHTYRPHRDGRGLRSHMEEIGHRLDVLRSVYPDERPNTRTEMLEQIERIQELCMDCLRLAAFVESGGSA